MDNKLIEALNNISQSFNVYIDKIDQITDYHKVLIETINSINKPLYPLLENLNNNQKYLENLYEKYGQYGWTIPPNMETLWLKDVKDIKEANKFMGKYCKIKDINQIFSILLNNEKINRNDILEAMNCYKNKFYKSCILLLFSIIDGFLIKLQNSQNRSVSNANNSIKNHIDNKHKMFISYLDGKNISSCISELYKYANNFKIDCSKLNRNVVSHGMLERDVRRIDCKKIFLLLYNLLNFVSFYHIETL